MRVLSGDPSVEPILLPDASRLQGFSDQVGRERPWMEEEVFLRPGRVAGNGGGVSVFKDAMVAQR